MARAAGQALRVTRQSPAAAPVTLGAPTVRGAVPMLFTVTVVAAVEVPTATDPASTRGPTRAARSGTVLCQRTSPVTRRPSQSKSYEAANVSSPRVGVKSTSSTVRVPV